LKLFNDSGRSAKKWRMRARFIDLHKTKITICEPARKHVPPWIFKQSMGALKEDKRN
jgi:hypothetical protein